MLSRSKNTRVHGAIASDPILITRGKVNALTCDADGTRNRGRRCRRQMTVCEAAKPPFGPAFSLFKARLYATDLSDKGFCRVCARPPSFLTVSLSLSPSLPLPLRSLRPFTPLFILPTPPGLSTSGNPLMQMLIRDYRFCFVPNRDSLDL